MSVLEEAFRGRLARLAPQDPLVLAVSGGGDSVALAHLVRRAGRQAVVAHLDHALRPDSGEDLLFVRDLAFRLGFPFYGERVEVGRIARERGENLEALARFEGEVTPELLVQAGLLKKGYRLKILGDGEAKPLKVVAHAFSKSALEKLKAAGGEAVLLEA